MRTARVAEDRDERRFDPPGSGAPDPGRRLRIPGIVGLALVTILAVYSVPRSYRQILERNDFEDNYYVAAKCAASRCDWLYDRAGPVRDNFFVYPPSASVFFYPFSAFSYESAGLVFTLLKTTALLLLLWGAIVWQRDPPERLDDRLILMAAAAIVLIQPLNSDIVNGQVNLFVVVLAVAGVRLAMESRRASGLGMTLLAAAVAIKGSPILLFAVPLLHRRWKALATGGIAVVVLSLALPVGWYGPATARKLFERSAEVVDSMLVSNATGRHLETGKDMEISLSDIVFFTTAQWAADPAAFEYDWEERALYESGTSGPRRREVALSPFPLSEARTRAIWIGLGVATGLAFLLGRWWLSRRTSLHWTWDASVLIVLMLLLSPVVRRAHLVGLIFPVGFVLVAIRRLALLDGGWRALLSGRRALAVGSGLTLVLLLLSDDPGIVVPGSPMPYRPWLFFAQLGMLVVLTQLALAERTAPVVSLAPRRSRD